MASRAAARNTIVTNDSRVFHRTPSTLRPARAMPVSSVPKLARHGFEITGVGDIDRARNGQIEGDAKDKGMGRKAT